jgi:predicted nucleic acid-binding protein
MRLFLDANVLFSASISPAGRSAALIDLADRGLCQVATSAHAVEEARRNLEVRYPEAAARLGVILRTVQILPEASSEGVEYVRRTYGLPPEDAPILAAAIAANADGLVTGDRTHFGALFGRKADGVRILSLREGLSAALGKQ